jgi:hypothetical protein
MARNYFLVIKLLDQITHMKKLTVPAMLGLFALATFAAVFLLIVSAGVIASLPRSGPDGPVLVPFSLCVIASLGISLLIPWTAVGILVRESKLRIFIFIGSSAVVAGWYFLGGFTRTLFKAYMWGGG